MIFGTGSLRPIAALLVATTALATPAFADPGSPDGGDQGRTLTLPGLRLGGNLHDSKDTTRRQSDTTDSEQPLPDGIDTSGFSAHEMSSSPSNGGGASGAGSDAGTGLGTGDAAPAKPARKRSFDLFAGPQKPADPLDTRMVTAQPVGTAAAPAGQLGLGAPGTLGGALRSGANADSRDEVRARRDAQDGMRTGEGMTGSLRGSLRTTEPLDAETNPPLSAGVAGEVEPAHSVLRSNRPAEALGRIIRRREDDPFAALGIRAGSFILFPELLQTVGVSNNLQRSTGGDSGAFSETTLSARLVSDWARHQAEFNTTLIYRRNFAGDVTDEPEANADGRLQFDLGDLTTATLRGALRYHREDPIQIDYQLQGSERPKVFSSSLAGELKHEFGPLVVTGTATAAHEAYRGLPEGYADQSYTTLTGALRTGYRLSPALTPFVEASLGRRIFDVAKTPGPYGIDRNALLPALRGGVEIDLSEKLKGEVAAGYAWSRPDDDTAPDEAAPTFDGSLVWSPQRGTDVTLAGRTTFEPDSSGASATATYRTSLGLRHVLNARTELTAAVAAEYADSTQAGDDEWLLTGEAGFNYWLNRDLAFTGLYSHEQKIAQASERDYSADTISVGVRLRR